MGGLQGALKTAYFTYVGFNVTKEAGQKTSNVVQVIEFAILKTRRLQEMSFKSIDEIIEYAIEKEIEAAVFYEKISRQESFSGAREMFEEFAAEERKHQALLENFSADKEKIAAYEYKWIPDMKRSNYMVDLTYEPGMGYADIVRLAMKREETALKLYNDLAKKTDDKACIQVFKILAQEEAKHKQFLETMYDDFMAAQGD